MYDVGEYLDCKNCKCRKKLLDKLVEESTENIDEVKIAEMALFEHGNECVCSYTICVVLAAIALAISIGINTISLSWRDKLIVLWILNRQAKIF